MSRLASCPLSLHDALPIFDDAPLGQLVAVRRIDELIVSVVERLLIHVERDDRHGSKGARRRLRSARLCRSEEHTSELQSRRELVCRRLLAKKTPSADTKST